MICTDYPPCVVMVLSTELLQSVKSAYQFHEHVCTYVISSINKCKSYDE